jgi:uncharacterized membrane-anchored protein
MTALVPHTSGVIDIYEQSAALRLGIARVALWESDDGASCGQGYRAQVARLTPGDIRVWLRMSGALRVPEITALFWVIKGLSTAMGESTSDYLVHVLPPVAAVLLGFTGFVIALLVQLRMARYVAWTYWLTVVMVGTFGTMAADVLHVGLGVPYTVSSILYAIVLAAIFLTWQRTEHTLSIHTVDTPRRELFYWAAVVATFAMGTALGDFTAYTLHLGYFPSALIFAAIIAIPVTGYRWAQWNAVLSFWFAYVITRPLGASIADGLAKPSKAKGLGLGSGSVALAFGLVIVAFVAYLSLSKADVQGAPATDAEQA